MYCKYCGKPIDDDSKFCKTCGKSLANNNPNSNYSFLIGKIKPFFIPICLIILWYAISLIIFLYQCEVYSYIELIDIFVTLLITPLVYYLIYALLHKNKKYPLQLWNKEDKLTTKLIKISYIVYSCCIPWLCWDGCDLLWGYLIPMFFLWVIPSFFLYLIYLKVISFKYLVKSVLIISIITAAAYGIGYYSYYFFNLPPKASAEEINLYNKKGISSREEYSIIKPKRLETRYYYKNPSMILPNCKWDMDDDMMDSEYKYSQYDRNLNINEARKHYLGKRSDEMGAIMTATAFLLSMLFFIADLFLKIRKWVKVSWK